jgi:hypothetical protein
MSRDCYIQITTAQSCQDPTTETTVAETTVLNPSFRTLSANKASRLSPWQESKAQMDEHQRVWRIPVKNHPIAIESGLFVR